jgi:hypothetical protein
LSSQKETRKRLWANLLVRNVELVHHTNTPGKLVCQILRQNASTNEQRTGFFVEAAKLQIQFGHAAATQKSLRLQPCLKTFHRIPTEHRFSLTILVETELGCTEVKKTLNLPM